MLPERKRETCKSFGAGKIRSRVPYPVAWSAGDVSRCDEARVADDGDAVIARPHHRVTDTDVGAAGDVDSVGVRTISRSRDTQPRDADSGAMWNGHVDLLAVLEVKIANDQAVAGIERHRLQEKVSLPLKRLNLN